MYNKKEDNTNKRKKQYKHIKQTYHTSTKIVILSQRVQK